jgi:hypothetical protein
MLELIPNWRAWYKRWSTWLLLLLGGINLNDVIGVMPSIQQYVDPEVYRYAMIALPLMVIAVTNIKQKSVSGPPA